MILLRYFISSLIAMWMGGVIPLAHASSSFTVSNTNDSGAGSLRQALLEANASTSNNVTININIGSGTITLNSPLPMISNYDQTGPVSIAGGKTWVINGNGATIDGNNAHRAFFVSPVPNALGISDLTASNQTTPLNVTIDNLAVQNTQAQGGMGGGGGMGAGGAVYVNNFADVTLTDVNLSGNNATGGTGGTVGVGATAGLNTAGGGMGGDGGFTNPGGGILNFNGSAGGGGLGGNGGSNTAGNFGASGGGGIGSDGVGGGLLNGGNGGTFGGSGVGETDSGVVFSTGGTGGTGLGAATDGDIGGGGGGSTASLGLGSGGNGGFAAGGGGGGRGGLLAILNPGLAGGDGGFAGGGGAGGVNFLGGTGGDGGFGGGGGAGGYGVTILGTLGTSGNGGNGGFGGGGGTTPPLIDSVISLTLGTPGTGGVGGSDGDAAGNSGGGAGFGGALFVRSQGTLTIRTSQNNVSFSGNTVTGGAGGSNNDGAAVGQDGFFMGGSNITFAPAANQTLQLSGTIADDSVSSVPNGESFNPGSGAGAGLTIDGAGTVQLLNNNNTYADGTTVTGGGTVQVSNDGNLGAVSGDLTLDNGTLQASGTFGSARDVTLGAGNGTVDTNGFNITLSGLIDGPGALQKTGLGTLILQNAGNTYGGGTSVSGGGTLNISADGNLGNGGTSLTLGNGVSSGTLQAGGNIVTPRPVTLNAGGGIFDTNGSDITLNGVISGTGDLTKEGTGTLALSGANTYTGDTTINGGTLQAGVVDTLPDTTNVTLANGAGVSLDLNNNDQTIGTLAGGGNLGGNVDLGSATLTTSGNGSTTYAGVISGTGGLTKEGTGTLTLSGANTYTGDTTINGGTLQAGTVNTLPAATDVTLANSAGVSLDLNNNDQTISTLAGGGNLGGHVDLGSATLTTSGNGSTAYAGVISGTGNLTKEGTGTLTLSGANTYTGDTTINGGTLQAGAVNTLPATTDVTLANSAGVSLDLNNNDQTIGTLAGGGNLGGHVDLGSATLTTSGNGSTTYDGVISGTGNLTKEGTGTLTLSGANTYTGDTAINGGTLQAGAVNTLPATTDVTLANSAGVSLDLNNNDQTIGTLAGGGNLGGNVDLGSATLTTSGNGSTTYAGVISGTGNLTKEGTGTLTLSGVNTYTGDTAINGGTLQAGAVNTLPATTDVTLANSAGVSLDLNNNDQTIGTLAGGGNLGGDVDLGSATLTTSGNGSTTYAGVISGTGNLTKEGTGTLTLSGTNTYTGDTAINGGTIQAGAVNTLPATTDVTLANSAGVSLDLNNNDQTISTLAGGGNLGGHVDLGSATLTTSGNGSTTYAGVISGTGNLTKEGTGTLTLSGANTYTGDTAINGGTLALSGTGTISSSNAIVVNSTLDLDGLAVTGTTIQDLSGSGIVNLSDHTLTVGTNNNTTFSGTITGSGGSIIKQNSGTLTLSGTNNYTGLTTISGGTLEFAGDTSQLTGAILNNATLNFNQPLSSSFSGDIMGIGGLNKLNTNRLALSGNLTYSGPTTIAAGGTLALTSDVSGLTSPFNNSGTLEFAQNANTIFNSTISGTGSVIKTGLGTLTLTQDQNYTGPTMVSSGTLALNTTLTSDVTISSGATLLGTPTVNNLVNGGTLDTGANIGTITVNGMLSLTPTSNFKVKLNTAGQSDLINVSGTASLNGQITPIPEVGIVGPITYTVLTATGGVNGQFSNIAQTPAFTVAANYGANFVNLVVTKNPYGSGGSGPGQDLGDYLDDIYPHVPVPSDLADVFDLLNALPTQDALNDALDQIQPNVLSSLGILTQRMSDLAMNTTKTTMRTFRLQQRLNQEPSSRPCTEEEVLTGKCKLPEENKMLSHLAKLNLKPISQQFSAFINRPLPAQAEIQNLNRLIPTSTVMPQELRAQLGTASVWLQQVGQHFHQESQSHIKGVKSWTSSTAVGVDTLLDDYTLVGMTGSFSRNNFKWARNRGDGHINSYKLGFYGSFAIPNTGFYTDAEVFVGKHRYHTSRKIQFPGLSRKAKGNHWGTEYSGDFESGYMFTLPNNLQLTPYVQGQYLSLHENRFKEHNAGSLNMKIHSKDRRYLQGGVGGELAHLIHCQDWVFRPTARLGYTYRNGLGKSDEVKASLVDQDGSFTVRGDHKQRHLINGFLAFSALHNSGVYLHAIYNTELSNSEKTHEILLRVGWKF